jgi:hypothetical protein
MDTKPKISPNATYIFEDEDLDLLDEFTISTILDEATATVQEIGDEDETIDSLESLDEPLTTPTETAPARERPVSRESASREPTIDELMDASAAPASQHDENRRRTDMVETGTYSSLEVLLDPEFMFPQGNKSSKK